MTGGRERDDIHMQRCNKVLLDRTVKCDDMTRDICASPAHGRGSKVDCGVTCYSLIFGFDFEMSYDEKAVAEHALSFQVRRIHQLDPASRGIQTVRVPPSFFPSLQERKALGNCETTWESIIDSSTVCIDNVLQELCLEY